MFIETHAHYDDCAFEEDRHSLLSAVHDSGIDHIIDPGCDLSSTQQACTLAEKYDFVKEVLWQENGKFVGLDHKIPLGTAGNGISLSDAKGL